MTMTLMMNREAPMADTGTICDLIDRNSSTPTERPAQSNRKLHWSDIMVAGLGLAFLVAVSLHVSPTQPRQEAQPIVLKWMQEG